MKEAFQKPTGAREVRFDVGGVTCSDCAGKVEKAISSSLKGVLSVAVSSVTDTAHVVYEGTQSEEEFGASVAAVIVKLGYTATLLPPSSSCRVHYAFQRSSSSVEAATKVKAGLDREAATVFITAIRALHGVVGAAFTDSNKRLVFYVDYDPALTGARTLLKSGTTLLPSNGGWTLSLHIPRVLPAGAKEIDTWRAYFLVGLFLGIPVLLMTLIFRQVNSTKEVLNEPIIATGLNLGNYMSFLIAAPVQFIVAWPLILSTYKSLRYSKSANMDTLIVLSTMTAFIYSVVAIIEAMADGHELSESETFFETSVLLIMFIMLGRYLEAIAKGKASDVMSKFRELQAESAVLMNSERNGHEETINCQFIQRNDILKILAGARVPTDGVVIFGTSTVDEAMITGESAPVNKSVGSKVFGSTMNLTGVLHIRVSKILSENTVASIGKLVADAQNAKAPSQRIADSVAAWFVPCIVILALISFVLWFILASKKVIDTKGVNRVVFALRFLITTLVISCPCAIALAVPTPVMVGTTIGAKLGVLFKNGPTIEASHKVDTIVFDKTGTLTLGKPVVVEVVNLREQQDLPTDRFLYYLASAELSSEHPLGKAVVSYAKERLGNSGKNAPKLPDEFTLTAGRGIAARIDGSVLVHVGSLRWMQDNKVPVDDARLLASISELETRAATVIHMGVNYKYCGYVALRDAPKPEARFVVRRLLEMGIDVWMLSGDNEATAKAVAAEIGITQVVAGVLPNEKANKVASLQGSKKAKNLKVVAMVGDGINDSPALAQADVGIAVASGTDIALATADVVLLKNDLRDVLVALDLSRVVFRRIKINFIWSIFYNVVTIPFASGALYPAIKWVVPPAVAGFAEIVSSIPVILFSLHLKRYTVPKNLKE